MQPLNTTVRSSRTMGCAARSDRSMTLSRRCTSPTPPSCQAPWPSGPRGASTSPMRSSAAMSGPSARRISPAKPHMSGEDPPAVLGGLDERRQEGAVARLGRREALQVPLDADHELVVVEALDPLDQAVGCARADPQAGAQVVDGLVMEGVHVQILAARDALKQAVLDGPDVVTGLDALERRAVLDPGAVDVGHVLVQRASARDVEDLHA